MTKARKHFIYTVLWFGLMCWFNHRMWNGHGDRWIITLWAAAAFGSNLSQWLDAADAKEKT